MSKVITGIRVDITGTQVRVRTLSKSPRGTQFTLKEGRTRLQNTEKATKKQAVLALLGEVFESTG